MLHSGELKIDVEPLKSAWTAVGRALWHAQGLEHALVHFIGMTLKLPPSRDAAEIQEVMDALSAKTLGALIAELRKGNSTSSVSQFEQRVNHLLRERNWLAHASWSDSGEDVADPVRLVALLRRLDDLATESLDLHRFFGQLVVGWTQSQGATLAEIEQGTRDILQCKGLVD